MKETEIEIGTYFVAFHDVLNQGSLLKKWDNFTESDRNNADVAKAFFQSVGSVKAIRTDFDGLRSGLNRGNAAHDDIPSELAEDAEFMDQINKIRQGTILSQAFSDTNIWYCRTRDQDGTFFIRTAYHLIAGTAFAHLLALSRSTPCRGSITSGSGTDFLGDEIYGPCLVKAYELEAKVAQYPRVIIGDDLIRHIDEMAPTKVESVATDTASKVHQYHGIYIDHIRDLLFVDTDGKVALDFAGPKAARLFGGLLKAHGEDPIAVFSAALAFARSNWNRFSEARDDKHSVRYELLYRYLKSRAHRWYPT